MAPGAIAPHSILLTLEACAQSFFDDPWGPGTQFPSNCPLLLSSISVLSNSLSNHLSTLFSSLLTWGLQQALPSSPHPHKLEVNLRSAWTWQLTDATALLTNSSWGRHQLPLPSGNPKGAGNGGRSPPSSCPDWAPRLEGRHNEPLSPCREGIEGWTEDGGWAWGLSTPQPAPFPQVSTSFNLPPLLCPLWIEPEQSLSSSLPRPLGENRWLFFFLKMSIHTVQPGPSPSYGWIPHLVLCPWGLLPPLPTLEGRGSGGASRVLVFTVRLACVQTSIWEILALKRKQWITKSSK